MGGALAVFGLAGEWFPDTPKPAANRNCTVNLENLGRFRWRTGVDHHGGEIE